MNALRKACLRALEITALVGFLPVPWLLYRLMAGGGAGSGGPGPGGPPGCRRGSPALDSPASGG